MTLPGSKLRAAQAPAVDEPRSKWHELKPRFRYMFKPECVAPLETWYNNVAPYRQRDAFREVIKDIHAAVPDAASEKSIGADESLAAHRARHMASLYGAILSEAGVSKTRAWLLSEPPPAQVDKFRDVAAAVEGLLGPRSTTKEQFSPLTAAIPQKERHRIKIDWNSTKAFDELRATRDNPMDRGAVGVSGLPTISATEKPKTKGAIRPRSMQVAPGTVPLVVSTRSPTAELELEGVFTTNPDGSTVYRSKPAHSASHGAPSSSDRIIASFRTRDTSDWLPTTKELICNHGVVPVATIPASKHPAVARVTASFGTLVPSLQPRHVGPARSGGIVAA